MITYVKLQPQQTILIHGGTGGVGHLAVQLAKHLGATVSATVSSIDKAHHVKQLGADNVINYSQTSAAAYVKQYTNDQGFSVVFDTVGADNLVNCFQAASVHGAVICISAAGPHDLTPAFIKGLSLHMVMQPLPLITGLRRDYYGKILSHIAQLIDHGTIKPLIDPRIFTLSEIAEAHLYLEQGKAIGKVVVTI